MGEPNLETGELERIMQLATSYEAADEECVIEYMRAHPEQIAEIAMFVADQFPGQPLPVASKLGALLERVLGDK